MLDIIKKNTSFIKRATMNIAKVLEEKVLNVKLTQSNFEQTLDVAAATKAALIAGKDTGGTARAFTVDSFPDASLQTYKQLLVSSYNFGFNGTSWDKMRLDANKNLLVSLAGATGNGIASDSFSNDSSGLHVNNRNMGYNGINWERQRNNTEGPLLVSAVRNTTFVAPDQINHNAKGVIIHLDVSARTVGASPQVSLQIQAKDPVSGNYKNLYDTGAFDPTVQLKSYIIKTGALIGNLTGAGGNGLPRTWRVQVQYVGDVTDLTCSLGYQYLL